MSVSKYQGLHSVSLYDCCQIGQIPLVVADRESYVDARACVATYDMYVSYICGTSEALLHAASLPVDIYTVSSHVPYDEWD